MPITERDRNRLAAIIAQIKPPNSLAARLDTVSDEQCAYYARWEVRYEQWVKGRKAKHDDEIEVEARPYASMLEGHGPPTMCSNLATALFGETPKIPLNASDEQAAKMWLNEITQ